MQKDISLQQELIQELNNFLTEQKNLFPQNEILKIDLHCHDQNSDVPDELLGRILNVPETWLTTEKLLDTLEKSGCEVFTITNHNNAKSCFELKEQGKDILTGAEFTCSVNDFNTYIHVLTYGFNAEQEKTLNKLRKNVYDFQRYAFDNNIPTIWAHPLYQYSPEFKVQSLDFFKKMSLIFERYEVLNGQRDTWQNMLFKVWLDKLTPENIDEYSILTGIDPIKYCRDPYKKFMSGGSDSHMGIFSGLTGTNLHIPDLQKRIDTGSKLSELALEAIREGRMSPYGSHNNSEKLTIAFLDYVFQIALKSKDPGLLRILLHKGTTTDKIIALLVSNGFAELKRHKVTIKFIELFHDCFMGVSPSFTKRLFVPSVYKPIFDDAVKISKDVACNVSTKTSENTVKIYKESIYSISSKLNNILVDRLVKKLETVNWKLETANLNFDELIDRFELPSEIRAYTDKSYQSTVNNTEFSNSKPDITKFLDGLSFPFLASSLILAANFTSAKVLYNVRPLLEKFSEQIGCLSHPKRILWLTDTFEDNNGVSMVLKSIHKEIKERNLPIDIMVCSNTVKEDKHLIVMKPLAEFNLSFYKQQPIRIPNFLDIHRLFHEREYDRIVCSTEGLMGLAALYLKNAYSVKAHFYIHTDWIMFARKVMNLEGHNINRVRRILRAFYKGFDSLFVLNTDHQKWLTGKKMGFENSQVHLTAHWVENNFRPVKTSKNKVFGLDESNPVLLFSGRISKEKGVLELPEILQNIKKEIPTVRFVIAGTGPAEEELKNALQSMEHPDNIGTQSTIFLGWVDHEKLPYIYSAADLLILPSKFDTFSCAVLEALTCGLPVIAYKIKGPKDIINHGVNGYLVHNQKDMIEQSIGFFKDESLRISMKAAAIERGKDYSCNTILNQFMNDVELPINSYQLSVDSNQLAETNNLLTENLQPITENR